MDKVLLVARREYFAYVTAWGFWLGLIFTPLILLLAVGLPKLIESTQPARYYTVIDGSDAFQDALQAGLARSHAGDVSGEADAGTQSYVFIPPPETSLEGLRPYLLGEQLMEGPLGPRPLYAAFLFKGGEVEYWSDDVVSEELFYFGQLALQDLAREAAFRAVGINAEDLEAAIRAAPEIKMLSPSVARVSGEISFADRAPYFIAFGLSFMLWLLIFSVVNYLLTGTIEERSNKIFDTLLTSLSLPQLLTGKLLGVLGLSFTLIGVWSLASGFVFLSGGQSISPDIAEGLSQILSARLIVPALLSFILGYLMFGSLFLALGSLCDSIQEAQALLSPVFIIMMIPLAMLPVSMSSPDSPLLSALSWVPLLTPFLLILRVPTDISLWMITAQIVWMACFTLLVIWAGTRVYRAGAVHGAGLSEARSWVASLFGGRKA